TSIHGELRGIVAVAISSGGSGLGETLSLLPTAVGADIAAQGSGKLDSRNRLPVSGRVAPEEQAALEMFKEGSGSDPTFWRSNAAVWPRLHWFKVWGSGIAHRIRGRSCTPPRGEACA